MKKTFDASMLDWELFGCNPFLWKLEKGNSFSHDPRISCEVAVKAKVPGSVQAALRDAGIIPDWNIGDNAKLCEWVENRHWIYKTVLPDEWMDLSLDWELQCLGLDYSGWVYLNNHEVGTFMGTHIPYRFNLKEFLLPRGNILEIILDLPPRWLGEWGYTSQIKQWKTRFNYTWDWAPRLVQLGIWDTVQLIATDGNCIRDFRCTADVLADCTGVLWIKGELEGSGVSVHCQLLKEKKLIAEKYYDAEAFAAGVEWRDLKVELWWPNQMGSQSLYDITCTVLDSQGMMVDHAGHRIGFRNIRWESCEQAPPEADPWLCIVNEKPVFLQGFNFQPIRNNYADLTIDDYTKRMMIYQDIGTNCFRINACGYLEFECFYDLCDELGILVWQEFPLTSSGLDNWPPQDAKSIEAQKNIARSYIRRRQHHPSLMMWSGSNEQGSPNGNKIGSYTPCTLSHPLLAALKTVVDQEDPTRRYIPTSPLGPSAIADEKSFGKGIHWDVHGPNIKFSSEEKMFQYWEKDDALFRAEIYVSGAAPADMIRRYKGTWNEMPASEDNPMWSRPTHWWNDWDELIALHGREPETLEEYVIWSQEKQAKRLYYGMKACMDRFPQIGGSLMWGSHDTTPMPINSTIIDFEGNPKPSAYVLKKLWRFLKERNVNKQI